MKVTEHGKFAVVSNPTAEAMLRLEELEKYGRAKFNADRSKATIGSFNRDEFERMALQQYLETTPAPTFDNDEDFFSFTFEIIGGNAGDWLYRTGYRAYNRTIEAKQWTLAELIAICKANVS